MLHVSSKPIDWIIPTLLFLLITPLNEAFAGDIHVAPAFEPQAAERAVHRTHSHNDYEQTHPLIDALKLRFQSVEADIWLDGGEIKVAHTGLFFKGTLKELYLDPIEKIILERGSVYGDNQPFYLWLDIKTRNPEIVPVLHQLLEKYEYLSEFTDEGSVQKPVTIILSGTQALKQAYVETHTKRKAIRDQNAFDVSDPSADQKWQWYAINWSDLFSWEGQGPMPRDEHEKLRVLCAWIHSKNRKLRIYGVPEHEEVWKAALEAQVDLIGTDELSKFYQFVDAIDHPPTVASANIGTEGT